MAPGSERAKMEYPPRCEKHGDKMIYREVGAHAPGYTIWVCERCEKEKSDMLRNMFQSQNTSETMPFRNKPAPASCSELRARVMRIPGQVPLGNLNQADAAKFVAEIERRISAAFDEGENCVPIR